jgi:hypothetical protein
LRAAADRRVSERAVDGGWAGCSLRVLCQRWRWVRSPSGTWLAGRLRETSQRLREVEALRRAAKRQAAPFSRNDRTPNPKLAGRKSGAAHGRHAHRQPPQHIDQVVTVGLPGCCPRLRRELVLERVAAQHVEDLPQPHPLTIRYDIHIGRCRSCGLRAQPRHPEQMSDALGAAQLGPGRWRWSPACEPARWSPRRDRLARRRRQGMAVGLRQRPGHLYRIASGRGYQDAMKVLGADTWQILTSLLRTATQQARDPLERKG